MADAPQKDEHDELSSETSSFESEAPKPPVNEVFRQFALASADLNASLSSIGNFNKGLRSMPNINQDTLQGFRKAMNGISKELRPLRSASQQMVESVERVSKQNRVAFQNLQSTLNEIVKQVAVQNQSLSQVNTAALKDALAVIDNDALQQVEMSIAGMLKDIPALESEELLKAIRAPAIADLSRHIRFSIDVEGVQVDIATIFNDVLSETEDATAPERLAGSSEDVESTVKLGKRLDAGKTWRFFLYVLTFVSFIIDVQSCINDQKKEMLLGETQQNQEKVLQRQEAEEERDSMITAKLDTLIEIGRRIQPRIEARLAQKRIVTEKVRLRENPDAEASTMMVMGDGDVIDLIKKTEGWGKVRYSDGDKKHTGWVQIDHLKALPK